MYMFKNWKFNKYDELLGNELQRFIPGKVFDIHMHPYRLKDLNFDENNAANDWPEYSDMNMVKQVMGKFLGTNKFVGGLVLAYPTKYCNIDDVNDYVVEQLENENESLGSICISPDYPIEKVLKYLENPKIIGLKPYHVFSKAKNTFNSLISDFLPETIWQIADEKKLVITLHIVKDLAVADPGNQLEIREMCTKYPNARLILAHAARCFHAPNARKGLKSLRGLENVWFDMAAICESESIKEIIYEFGPRRVMWGSDFPVCMLRGKAVTMGMNFIWLQDDLISWEKHGMSCNPVLVGLESLRALETAAYDIGLNKKDIEDIFYNNAAKLLGIKKETGCITQELYSHAKQRIPGGTQLLSKRPELMAPNQWPAYYSEARGCEVWDMDGKHYYDMSTNGIGSCLLGYRDPDVTRAVMRRINLGSMSTLNPPEEVYLADKLLEIHPWAEQVRFARTGGEIAAVAIRIARATTHRTVIAVSGYHGWHDWYLAANLGENDALRGHLLPGLEPYGVPGELRGTTFAFKHGSRKEFQKILEQYGDKLAAIIMEPCRYKDPEPGFLEFVRDETAKRGILLIFDEITIGWRRNLGGAHLKLGINPDIAIFAKALGNGHPVAAVIGTKEAMRGANYSFISSTYWTESVGPAAALAVIDKLEKNDVSGYVANIGSKIMNLWKKYAHNHGLPIVIEDGYPCLAHFKFDCGLSRQLNTLYVQLMLERGFLAGTYIYPTFSHTDKIVDLYGEAIDEVFGIIAGYIKEGTVQKMLKGPVAHTGFRRLI